MKTKPRRRLKEYEIQEAKLPYEIMYVSYEPAMRYRDRSGRELPQPIEERQTHVHVTIYDDSEKYIWGKHTLTQKMHSGYTVITNEDVSLETAMKIAKLDALEALSKDCHGHESIYVCLPKNLSAFFARKPETFTQAASGNKEHRATGFITVIETRTC